MPEQEVRVIGRYALYNAIAAGGMATVHLGRLLGPVGFSRTVAIKRLHAQFASDPEFVSMFLDEARLAARIRHPNVVPTLDVVATGGELFLVMDYVPGESLARLSRALRERQQTIPLKILSAAMAGVLHGLHAAHEAKDERGHPLGIVHRDVSPQNVLIGTDGVPRVLDFGVAKAAGRMQTTKEGQIKGKLAYMPPEQLRGAAVSRQTDIYAVGVMLWEMVTGQRLFSGDNEGVIVAKVLEGRIERPSAVLAQTRRIPMSDPFIVALSHLDSTILRALSMQPEARFSTAREMALELERKCPPATASECGDWVEAIARDVLNTRAAMVAEIESSASMMSLDGTRENPIDAVLNAKATLEPGARLPMPSSPSHVTPSQTHSQRHAPLASTLAMPYPPPIPPVTQPSSISVSTGLPGQPSKSTGDARRVLLVALAAALASVAVVVGFVVIRGLPPKPTTASSATAEPGLPPAVTETPAPVSAAPISAAPASAGSATVELDAPDAAAPPPVQPPVVTTPKAPPAVTPTPKPPRTQKPTPTVTPTNQDDCNPPFWFGKDGVKHYKEHCVGK